MDRPNPKQKSFVIPKSLVWEAWRRVKANKGAAGVDGQDLASFEADLKNNLFKIWNRMSSGSYVPPAVRAVQIPKTHQSGYRMLGIPTVADRVAQTVVAMVLEPLAEPRFSADSYGYRPGVSAHDALAVCRTRCWKYDWVIDLDVQKFFDEVPWELVLKAVQAVCSERWVLLYVRRWLAAALQHPDGSLEQRTRGTPQGSAVSPILSNLFMHYAFDSWMRRSYPACPFERYADDAVVHCTTLKEAQRVLAGIEQRMGELGLRLHPEKTRIVYCKDDSRRGEHQHTRFTFLGFEFRPRSARRKQDGKLFTSFLPAISPQALKAKNERLRGLRIDHDTQLALDDLARWLNPIVGGWMDYYGRYNRSELYRLLQRVNLYIRRWAARKYKRLRAFKRFKRWWSGVQAREPTLFRHWAWVRSW